MKTKHDSKVRKIAGGYKSQGWKVHADVSGYPTPKTIYGRRPDVIATKGKQMIIVEVETKESYPQDVSQRNAFKRFVSQGKRRKFRTSIV